MVVLLCPPADEFVELRSILKTRSIRCETRIMRQFGLSYRRCQRRKVLIVLHGNSAPLIISAAWIDIMRSEEAIVVTIALLDITIDGIFNDGSIGECSSRKRLTKVDPLSLTCTPGITERGNNRKSSAHTTTSIRIACPYTRRLAIWPTSQVNYTSL